jgi:transcriptional regulator with XRE-family HTH domain
MQLSLPKILKKIRLDRDLSIENIADELKIDPTTYGRYEKEKGSAGSRIKFEQVVQLAQFYGLTLDELSHYGDPNYHHLSNLAEPMPSYQKKRSVILSIELDGQKATFDYWVEKLKKVNAAIA